MTTTIDRAAINRRNAQKSTGPRTPEGKNRSRFNAVKHGMTARTLVLPDEDASVLQMRLETWINDLQPQNEVEQALVEQAVHASWKLERADRAEVARLSRIIESVPVEEANRHREEVAALGRRLFSDRDVTGDAKFQNAILNALLPGRKTQSSRPLDVLDHPEAIVPRLESTAAGCQWLLDRWTELHDILDQGQTWPTTEKVKAIRLLGKQPLDMTPEQWENHRERRFLNPDPDLDAHFDRQLDRQLDDRLAEHESATNATLRSVVDRAIARLETLAAGHRERAEAVAAQQAAILSFDASAEGERLRRYQFSCSRSLFRSLDTLLKLRRAGLGAEPSSVFPVPPSIDPPVDDENRQNEPTATPVGHASRQDEPKAPPVEDGNLQNKPTTPAVAAIARPRLPFLCALLSAVTLVVFCGAAVRSHRNPQTEPISATVTHRNLRNEPIPAPSRVDGADVNAVAVVQPPGMPPRSIWGRRRLCSLDPSHGRISAHPKRRKTERAISTSQPQRFTHQACLRAPLRRNPLGASPFGLDPRRAALRRGSNLAIHSAGVPLDLPQTTHFDSFGAGGAERFGKNSQEVRRGGRPVVDVQPAP